jgi:deazaflavin-dependent oxidoreductase (nitroreductase family)
MSLSNDLFVLTLRVHQQVYERTGGLVGHRILGRPTLLLHTTGRKSGKSRTNALVYVRDGERYLVVPSNGGHHKPPAWLLNLQAQPAVEIQVGRDRRPGTATVIGADDPDFARVWKLADDHNGGRYTAYQGKTGRPIPVVALQRS